MTDVSLDELLLPYMRAVAVSLATAYQNRDLDLVYQAVRQLRSAVAISSETPETMRFTARKASEVLTRLREEFRLSPEVMVRTDMAPGLEGVGLCLDEKLQALLPDLIVAPEVAQDEDTKNSIYLKQSVHEGEGTCVFARFRTVVNHE